MIVGHLRGEPSDGSAVKTELEWSPSGPLRLVIGGTHVLLVTPFAVVVLGGRVLLLCWTPGSLQRLSRNCQRGNVHLKIGCGMRLCVYAPR